MIASRTDTRNALHHGRWLDLKAGSSKVDINEAIGAVVEYMWMLEDALRRAKKIA